MVCSSTGAGKNIAMVSILHEALAAEVTSTLSYRISPLNVTVSELIGDMQHSKNEIEKTQ
ncbi:activating signal cointegrator 1 complex subunit [Castilleja foliolosa]|uniref:Activating signal cointegrator 1 complex subunit n=1 Tax=Castilleja foliolosa TaxID=1961234 RepID=A0ABD3BWE6_9LAMI